MSKFFKSLLLLLSAGLFTATGWAETITVNQEIIGINFTTSGKLMSVDANSTEEWGYYSQEKSQGGLLAENKWQNFTSLTQNESYAIQTTGNPSLSIQLKKTTNNGVWGPGSDKPSFYTENKLLGAYLDNGSTLEFYGLPASGYDVAIIFAGDGGTKLSCVTVNGTDKTYNENGELVNGTSSWGERKTGAADLKQLTATGTSDAERVMYLANLNAETLKLQTYSGVNSKPGRGTIAAIQIYLKSGVFKKPSPVWTWDGAGGTDSGEEIYGIPMYTISGKVINADDAIPGGIPANNFTFSYWSKMTDGTNWRNYAGFSDTNGGLMIQKSGANRINIYNSGCVGDINPACEFTLSSTTPQLLTFVSKNGTLKVYVDGVYVSETTPTSWPSFAEANPMKYFGLGIAPSTTGGSAGNGYISAYVGDARVYREALSAEQVETLYLSYLSNYYSATYPILSMDDDVDDDGMISKTELTAETAVGDADQFCISGAVTVNKGAGDPLNWPSLTLHAANASSDSLTIAGENTLTATTTVIGVDTTVETGAANLGTVTINTKKTLTVKEAPTNVYTSLSNNGALCLDGGDATTPLTIVNNNALGKILLADGAVVKMTATGGNKIYNIEGVANAEVKPELRLHSGQNWGVTIPGSAFKNVKLVLPEKNSNDGSGTYSFWLTPSTLANDASVDLEIKGGQGLTFENVNSVTAVFGSFVTNGAFSGTTVQTGTGEISGNGGTTNITVTNSGEGSFTVARAYGSSLTIGSNGRVTVAEGGSLTGSVTVTGALTYAADATPTNTITNNGTITADTATVDLTGATISGSGTYGVTNNGTLILKARTENGASVTSGTLKLLLSEEDIVKGYTANVAEGTTVTFVVAGDVDGDGDGYDTLTEGVDGNEYAAPMNVWTPSEDATWANTVNWSNEALPSKTDNVEIQIVENTELVLTEDVAVAALRVTGTGTLSITGGKLTASFIDAETAISASDETLALVPMTIAENVAVTYGTTANATMPALTGSGTFTKNGTATLTLGNTTACEPTIDVTGGTLELSGDLGGAWTYAYDGVYRFIAREGATIDIANAFIDMPSTESEITLKGGALLNIKNGNTWENRRSIGAKILIEESSAEKPAIIKGSTNGDYSKLTGGITGSGVLEIQSNGNTFAITGAIKDQENAQLAVKINTANGVTFSGANTYTGGTVIATGAQLINNNGSALGGGKVTGAGTLIVNIGQHPGNHDKFGFAEAGWQGTVEFTGGNFQTAVDFAKWQNANSTFKVASGATISAANSSSVTGTLMGGGTITNALTFASGATLDATTETLTATGTVNFGETLNVKVSGDDIVGTQILKKADANITEEVVVEDVTVVVNGNEGYCLAQNAEGYVLREKVANPEVSATVPAGGTTSLSVALGGNELAANTILTINFGDGTTPGFFTFDNEDEASFAQIIVKGTNGGTIEKSETAAAVTTALATINTTVTVDAGVATFTATEIPAGGALTVADTATVSAVSGAGVLAYNGVLPANMTGLTDAATWTGTLALVSTPTQEDIAFNDLGNASSTVRLQDYTGSLSNKTAATCYTPNLEIKGKNTINAATAYAIPIFQGDISGDGTIVFSSSENTNYLFSGDFSAFTGTMELTHTSPKIAIGAASNTDWNAWNPIVNNGQGNITIATAATLNGTFRAVSGVETTSSAILSGNGTIDCSLALAANATIDASETLLTVTGDITLPNTLTVKVAATPTAVTPVSILTTTATPNVANTTVTVIVNEATLGSNFELVKNGDKLQVRVAPDRIAASETPDPVTEVPSAIFLDTATFSGYGQTFTVLQYTGTGTPNWDDMYVEGLPEGAQVIKTDTTWGFKNNCLNVLTVGDSITAGLVYYYNSNANWHVPGGYRLPLYKRLTRAGYSVKYLGSSDVFGTSSVGGNNANEANPSPSLGDNDHHEGHSGITLDTMISRFGEANVKAVIVAQGTPDVITLHLGTNDFGLAGDTVENAFAEMKKLLYLLNGACDSSATDDWKASVGTPLYPNAKIFVAKIMPRADSGLMTNKIDPFNEDLAEYVTSCNLDKLVLVDLGMANNYGLLRHDGLHPSTEGYAQMAKGWYEAIDAKFDPYGEATAAPTPATSTPTEDVTESDRAGNSKTKGVLKAAEWTTFTGFATGFTSQFGYMQDSERPWQLDVRGTNEPEVTDGVLSLNGAPITVNPVDGRLGTTKSTYTIVMKVSNLAANDVIFTDSSVRNDDWPENVNANYKGTTNADLGKLTVVDADTLQWTYNGLADGPTIDLVGVNLTDSTPDVIAITVTCNQCKVAVNGGAAVTVSQGGESESYRGSWSIGAKSTAETGSSMKLYRLSFYEGEATLLPPATVVVNVDDYASWNAALEAGAVSTAMASVTLNFTDVDQTFTFDNTSAVTLGIAAVTAAEGVTGGTIALASDVEVKMASLSLQTNVTAPVAFYNACIGSITAGSATTVVAMNDATEATLTTPIVGGVLKQVGEGTITFAPTGNWTASTSPAKFEVANGSLVLNKTSTGWNNPPQLIVSGGTLDLNDTYTFATGGSGYLKNVANEALVVMGGTEASTVTNGAITPYTPNANTASTIIKYNGAEGANAPATFAANIAGVYSDGDHPRLINVEQGKQTDGYDLEISGTMGVEGQQFAGTTVKKTGAGVLKISGENNFNTLEITEGTLWSANANALSATTKVKSGATLVGAGTVATAFTLEENATLDVTKGVVTANGTVSLPNALKLVVETLPTAETHVTILSTTAFVDATGDVNATLTINGNAAPDYILRKTADAVELHYAPWTTVTEVTASGNVKSWSALLAEMTANRQVLDASTGVFIIDFGDKLQDGEAVPGSFEFNNTDTLTFASVKVMGSNGGTITKTGSGAVSATATTIEEGCTVTVPASTATLNAVEIKQDATLKVADVTTVTTATGVGTLYVAGIDGNVGLKLKGVSAETKVVLDGVRCYIDNGGNGEVECPIEIGENGFTIMNGWATGSIEFSGALTGEGLLTYAPKQNGAANGTSLGYLLTLTNVTGFEGGITLDGEYTKLVIGSGTADAGKIVIAASVTIAQDATWTATNGISVTGEGTISGTGKISIPSGKELTYASTATSTFNGVIEGAGGLTVSTGTLTLTGANTYNGATTIAEGAKVIANSGNSSTWDYMSGDVREPDVTVNGELEIQSTGELYRGFAGTGKITTSGNVTIGMTGDSGHVSGLTNFKGELIVADGTTLTLKGWSLPHDIELSSLQANGNVTATHAGANPSTTQMTVHKLAGSGTIAGVKTFTLADGATIDVSAATAVTVNATTISLPDALAVTLPDAAEMPVTLLNTTAFADATGDVNATLTINGNAAPDYILRKTANAVELDYSPWTTKTEVTASGAVNSWSALLAEMAANRWVFDTTDGKTPSLIIDFGSEGGEAGTFTFDLEDATALSLTKVTIQGTNGGTIQKSGTANVTATATAVNTNVEITENAMLLGQTTLAANCTLTVNDSNALGEATDFSAGEGSTVKLVNVDKSTLDLGKLTNATGTSNLILNNVKAYIYDCKINTLTLEGDFQMNNGTTNKLKTQCVTVNALAGAGTFIGHQSSEVYVAVNVKSWTNFTGSIDLSNEKSAGTIFFFGTAPERFADAALNAYDEDDAQEYFANDYGTIYVTEGDLVTAVGSTWKAPKVNIANGTSLTIQGWFGASESITGLSENTIVGGVKNNEDEVVEAGVLDLRALADLSGINVTVKAGGRLLVNTGASVPNTIVFEAGSILGVATKHVEDVGNATLTVNVDGTAATTATIKGYHMDGVTELDNWAKNDETSSEGEFKFNFDPVFDGELCWWAYEFDNEVNTTAESNLGPISTGRDKTRMNFDGRGDSNRVCQDNEYLDHGDGTKAIRVASSPWRNVDGGYPTAFTAAMYGTLTENRNRIIMGFGSSYNQKYTIALVTGASTDEVRLVLQKGWNENNTDYPEDAVITLATTTVPNAVTENHLFAFSYEQFDSEDDDKELDSTRIIFYVDGEKYQPFTAKAIIPLGNGFQMGSIHGGWHNSLTRMNDDDVDCTMEYLRIYDQILPESVWTAMSNEYSYMSKNGRATRTIVAGADTTWNEGTEWKQVRAVKDGNGGYVLDAEGHVTFDSGTLVEKPDHGENVGTQVVLNVSGENTLYLNEFYSNPIQTQNGEVSKLYYERLEINPEEGGDEDSLTLWAGRLNPAIEEEDPLKNSQSAVITVQGYTKINTNVTMAHNVAFLSGPVAVAEGKWLRFDFSGFDVMKVPSMPVTYRLTGFLDEDTRTRVTSTAPADPVNARSIDLGYKTTVNQYTFTVNRYPVTAYFTADEMAGGNSTDVNFNNLNYVWQGNDLGKQMNWEAEAVDPQGNPIVENTLAKFVSLDAETQKEKMVTVTLATNDAEPITLTLEESDLSKETTPAGQDTEAVVEPMLGEQQLIVGNNVIVNYTGTAAKLARTLNEASAETTGVIRTAGFTVDTWRANLSVTGGALAGVGKISGKVTFEEGATLDASAATAEACLSAKDADLTNLKAIKVNVDAAAGKTLKVLSLPKGHTATSLIGCTVTAVDSTGNTVAIWTETGDDATLVVVRAGGLYVVGRPVVKAGETEVTNNDLTLPLARRAAELSATSVSLTGVVNMAGDEVKGVSVADAAEVFTNVAFDMTETPDGEGVVTAKLKYDFGVSQINVVTIESVQYVVAELIVSNNKELGQNTAAYAADTTIDVVVTLDNNGQDVNVEAAANMMGETVAPAAELPASTRYIRFQMPDGNGTFEIKARAAKSAPAQQ